MPMIAKPFDKIDGADIVALVANREDERRTMDFKRDLPGKANGDKHELRADVTSFANAGGGDLIFGVAEEGGVAKAIPGLPGVDADKEICRIESVIQSGVDPRVPGVESRKIDMPDGAPVILVRVAKSWRGPHLVKINDTFRMYGRNSKGKYIFDATEIRSAFLLSEDVPERIRRWRDDRLAKVIGGDAAVSVARGGGLVIHVVPLASFAGQVELSVAHIDKQQGSSRPPYPKLSGYSSRINLDGLVTFSRADDDGQSSAYCQVFRTGRVEAVSTRILYVVEGEGVVLGEVYEETAMWSVETYLEGLKELGVQVPMIVLMTIWGAKGARLLMSRDPSRRGQHLIDRDVLVLPEVLVETHRADVPTLLRPVFDAVWNAGGWLQSLNYDEQGRWRLRQ
jgi:hypothetical protein